MKKETLKKGEELVKQIDHILKLINNIDGPIKEARIVADPDRYGSLVIGIDGKVRMSNSNHISITEGSREALAIMSESFHSSILKVLKIELEKVEKEFEALQDEPEMELIDG